MKACIICENGKIRIEHAGEVFYIDHAACDGTGIRWVDTEELNDQQHSLEAAESNRGLHPTG